MALFLPLALIILYVSFDLSFFTLLFWTLLVGFLVLPYREYLLSQLKQCADNDVYKNAWLIVGCYIVLAWLLVLFLGGEALPIELHPLLFVAVGGIVAYFLYRAISTTHMRLLSRASEEKADSSVAIRETGIRTYGWLVMHGVLVALSLPVFIVLPWFGDGFMTVIVHLPLTIIVIFPIWIAIVRMLRMYGKVIDYVLAFNVLLYFSLFHLLRVDCVSTCTHGIQALGVNIEPPAYGRGAFTPIEDISLFLFVVVLVALLIHLLFSRAAAKRSEREVATS